MTGADGGVAQGLGQEGLADAGGAHQQDVFVFGQEFRGEDSIQKPAVQGNGGGPVEVLQAAGLLKDSKHGFPCKVADDPLLKLVLPPIEDGEYRFAEERRLFYVALTRARKGVYLVVDERQPSSFARELLDIPSQEIRLIKS